MFNERHSSQTCHQHILLQRDQVDEGTELARQVAVMGEGGWLGGGVSGERHWKVATTEHQLEQVVPPARDVDVIFHVNTYVCTYVHTYIHTYTYAHT